MGVTTLPKDRNGNPVQAYHPDTARKIDVTTTSAASNDLGGTSVIRVCATAACFIKFGSAGVVATTSDHYLPANTIEYFSLGEDRSLGVLPATHVAAITATGTGVLYISTLGLAKPRGRFTAVAFNRRYVLGSSSLKGVQVGTSARVVFSSPAASGTLGLTGIEVGFISRVIANGACSVPENALGLAVSA